MFHQVKVPEDERDSLRFLWWPIGDTNHAMQEFRMTSHVFGVRSSPSVVNFCLRQAALDYGDKERDKSVATLDLSKDELPTESTLGIHRGMSSDEFTFKINLKEKPRKRRGVLSVVPSLYDPLGFVSPFTLKGKMLLQDLCHHNLPWDEEMNNDEANCWSR
ncbi:uncharacterized protein [Palaemon carinicauda]|uniref:uncharacterized protein n=1 Tax=Palaemon carinicauda TaxID=392227 RepID=UPI0035B5E915